MCSFTLGNKKVLSNFPVGEYFTSAHEIKIRVPVFFLKKLEFLSNGFTTVSIGNKNGVNRELLKNTSLQKNQNRI